MKNKQIRLSEEMYRYILTLYYEVNGVSYQEANTDEHREILQTYIFRKEINIPKVYDYVEYICNDENNNEVSSPKGNIRVDALLYVEDNYDNVTIDYTDKATDIYFNSTFILRI